MIFPVAIPIALPQIPYPDRKKPSIICSVPYWRWPNLPGIRWPKNIYNNAIKLKPGNHGPKTLLVPSNNKKIVIKNRYL
jgi:hypothetical protein